MDPLVCQHNLLNQIKKGVSFARVGFHLADYYKTGCTGKHQTVVQALNFA